MTVVTIPQSRWLLLHHVLELVQAQNAIAVGVVLGEYFLPRVLFVIFATCSLLHLWILFLILILLAFFENEVVESQELVVELTDDLEAPVMSKSGLLTGSLIKPLCAKKSSITNCSLLRDFAELVFSPIAWCSMINLQN